ncbi:cold-shock protein [Sunxiuqinia indica]|uniref:cold-shock protein n=1 Tax=Sunxiuqinia indica TaxID=2692584 RepID=UPI001359415B|nr:cold shock domain-containing protein [Sunxiuqinia indica]
MGKNKATVTFHHDSKGFEFIKDANLSEEYFAHSSGLKDSIGENDEVTFDLEEGKKGLNAVNVKLASLTTITIISNFIPLKAGFFLYQF